MMFRVPLEVRRRLMFRLLWPKTDPLTEAAYALTLWRVLGFEWGLAARYDLF